MNNSNAAAKRRRAGIQPSTPPLPTQNIPAQNSSKSGINNQSPAGFTLQQAIALIDTRLIILEQFMKDTKESTDLSIPNYKGDNANSTDNVDVNAVFMDSKEFTDFVDDINQRFQLFADEINGLKEIVLKLQGFTMDVNKMLLAILGKNGETIPNITFDIDENITNDEQNKTENTDQTFVFESSNNTSLPSDTIEKPILSSGKNKKR